MKWYWIVLLIILALAAGFAAGYFACWWKTPLGPPLDIHKLATITADYKLLWIALGAGCVLLVDIPLAAIAYQLKRLVDLLQGR